MHTKYPARQDTPTTVSSDALDNPTIIRMAGGRRAFAARRYSFTTTWTAVGTPQLMPREHSSAPKRNGVRLDKSIKVIKDAVPTVDIHCQKGE